MCDSSPCMGSSLSLSRPTLMRRTLTRSTTAALACVLTAISLVVDPAVAQEQDNYPTHAMCYCRTITREEPITFLGFQIGTRTVTETQCWYEPAS